MGELQGYLDLVDWRRRVGDLYRVGVAEGLGEFRRGRDRLFRTHPQSPIPADTRDSFQGLRYFEGDPAYRIACRLEARAGEDLEIDTGGEDGVVRYRRAGRLAFDLVGTAVALTVFSLVGYGGGLFLPFRDATSAKQTYGGGRYLLDTAKGADLGGDGETLRLDFNFAYHPSCHYDPQWVCPLAPPANRLAVAIEAGELTYPGASAHELQWCAPS